MKRVKLLLILSIAHVVVLVASIVVGIIVLPKIMSFGENELPLTVVLGTEEDKNSGFAQVTSYGAVADDGKDDTAAFKKALATNASVYLPVGTYDLSETLNLDNRILKGCGSGATVIRSSAKKIAVSVSGNAVIEDLTVCFTEDAILKNEGRGERVAVYDAGLTQGSMLRGVGFKNVGTGFLSDAKRGAFCTTLEAITFNDYSYKAIDIADGMSTVLRACTIGKGRSESQTPVSLGGVVTVESMTFASTECSYAVELKNATSAFFRSVTFNGVRGAGEGLISCDASRFTIQTATLLDTACKNLIAVNDAEGSAYATEGVVNMIYTDGAESVSVSNDDKIKYDINLK